MRRSTVVVARVAGVRVRVHPTAVVLMAAITWVLATQLVPAAAPGIGPFPAWLLGGVGAVLVEAGVVAHELGHAVVARRAGLHAETVDLRLLGGVTEIVGELRRPRDQLWIAAIGPAVSLGYGALAAALTVLAHLVGAASVIVALGGYVAVASVVIGLVNLLPGAPLDGGRILQGWWWLRCGDRRRAGVVAGRAGQCVAGLLLVAGIALTVTGLLGVLGGVSVATMGVLTWLGARRENQELASSNVPDSEVPDFQVPRLEPVQRW